MGTPLAFRWHVFIQDDEDEGSGFKREIKKKLKKQEERRLRKAMAAQGQDLESEGGAFSLTASPEKGITRGPLSRTGSADSGINPSGTFESLQSLRSPKGGGLGRSASEGLGRSASKGKLSITSRINQISRTKTGGEPTALDDQKALIHDSEEDIDDLYRCPLTQGATSEEKKMWIVKMGKHLLFTGSIALPVLKWDAGNDQECLVSLSPCCVSHKGPSTRF